MSYRQDFSRTYGNTHSGIGIGKCSANGDSTPFPARDDIQTMDEEDLDVEVESSSLGQKEFTTILAALDLSPHTISTLPDCHQTV